MGLDQTIGLGQAGIDMPKISSSKTSPLSVHSASANEPPFEQPCPIRDVLNRIGDQWSLLVLETLYPEKKRFNELMREIGDISKQMLSRTLKKLEQDGFITREVYPEIPPCVEYELTSLGHSFLKPMRTLVGWTDDHHRDIVNALQRYQPAEQWQQPK